MTTKERNELEKKESHIVHRYTVIAPVYVCNSDVILLHIVTCTFHEEGDVYRLHTPDRLFHVVTHCNNDNDDR